MIIWVIGSQGMLGSTFLDFCRKKGLVAVGTTRQAADVTDFSLLQKAALRIQPTHIVNCAAFTDVDGAEKDPKSSFAVNAEGAANVARIAAGAKARLLHISTDYVFSGKSAQPYREEDSCEPVNTYGRSKREGELEVLKAFPKACILRTSWLFGAQGKNFISSVFKWLQEKEELQVVVDQCGKPTYCQDLAQAMFLLLNEEGIVHFANEGASSRYQIALDIAQKAKELGHGVRCQKISPVPSAQFPTPATRPAYTALDTRKFYQLTNQKPRSWGEVLHEFISYALSI